MATKYFCYNKLELKILDIALTQLKRSRRLPSSLYGENESLAKQTLTKLIQEVRTEYGADWMHNHIKPCTNCSGAKNSSDSTENQPGT